MLEPGETRSYDLQLAALRSRLETFEARVAALGPAPA